MLIIRQIHAGTCRPDGGKDVSGEELCAELTREDGSPTPSPPPTLPTGPTPTPPSAEVATLLRMTDRVEVGSLEHTLISRYSFFAQRNGKQTI